MWNRLVVTRKNTTKLSTNKNRSVKRMRPKIVQELEKSRSVSIIQENG